MGVIRVVPQLRPPPLLSACRQIRSEARSIWYLTNIFEMEVHDIDATLINAWARHTKAIGLYFEHLSQVRWRVYDSYDWGNLMAWMKAIWAREPTYCQGRASVFCRTTAALFGATRITEDNIDLSWKECAEALDDFRVVLGQFDYRWRA